ncbi:DUF6113 family protein [Streptomyces sp. RFCAC02]|uniref:DUF6113 family protein n=1 Tax=Streptomyces sp. RFCAC02 TaxID=2499143 RepID=UPI001021906B|nr:DUF6113 family protein [Streptomyces sp. RFCAC02]
MRIAVHVALALLGVLAGIAGSLVQGGWLPFGLILALAGTAGLFWGAALLTRSRAGAGIAAAGWALAVLLLTSTRPQGDFIFASGASSYVFLLGGMVLAVLAATLAPADRPMFAVTTDPARRR